MSAAQEDARPQGRPLYRVQEALVAAELNDGSSLLLVLKDICNTYIYMKKKEVESCLILEAASRALFRNRCRTIGKDFDGMATS